MCAEVVRWCSGTGVVHGTMGTRVARVYMCPGIVQFYTRGVEQEYRCGTGIQ
jgi:hypothetical protein